MFARIFVTALGAGAFVGLVLTALQLAITSPMIVAAEAFEGSAVEAHSHTGDTADGHDHDHGEGWAPADGFERHLFTGLASVLTAIGFALALTAAMVLKGGAITGRTGLLWGIAGFAAVSLAPALGLAPELPASAAAGLGARQAWWVATAAATAAGIALMVFSPGWGLRLAGVALIALPHILGAPRPGDFTSTAPAELAGNFAAASLALAAVFWALLGWSAGALWERLERRAA
jgi:cobalt transporter subunit CbtA